MAAYYDHMVARSYKTHYVATENEVRIHCDMSIAATTIQKFIDIDLDWTVSAAGAVTVDLLELELDTGRATSYKWGAAPSYSVSDLSVEKVGTAGPPPGLSVTESREMTARLSLRRGEIFVLVSDGIGEDDAMRCCKENLGRSAGELAAGLMNCGQTAGEDDATVITVRLAPSATGT